MHPAYGAPAKKTASTKLSQYNVEPPGFLSIGDYQRLLGDLINVAIPA
jgi:hypothetical protein